MRGNEDANAEALKRELAKFTIPMRGNENEVPNGQSAQTQTVYNPHEG